MRFVISFSKPKRFRLNSPIWRLIARTALLDKRECKVTTRWANTKKPSSGKQWFTIDRASTPGR